MDSNIVSGLIGVVGSLLGVILGHILSKKKDGPFRVLHSQAFPLITGDHIAHIDIKVGFYNDREKLKSLHSFGCFAVADNGKHDNCKLLSKVESIKLLPNSIEYFQLKFQEKSLNRCYDAN